MPKAKAVPKPNTGAWFLGGYRAGMAGSLGESLDLASTDNLGWTLRSWKMALALRGWPGKMKLETAALGAAADTQIRHAQKEGSLTVDGVIGPKTGKAILIPIIDGIADEYGIAHADLRGIIAHESGYDLGAIGTDDHLDRGLTQKHLWPGNPPPVLLSQAIRPMLAIPRLAAQIKRLAAEYDDDTAIASWNCGEGGAEWWYRQGKPAKGSPSWWTVSDLSARATAYVKAVRDLGAS